MLVLVVADDATAAESLARDLRRHGHNANRVDTGEDALKKFHCADLVLLDLELPDLDGLEVCRAIRAVSDTPIIALTAHDSEFDRVLGLQAGSDDCLVKPYGSRELIARIEAVMRRSRPRQSSVKVISRGALNIDSGSREVRLHGKLVSLTRKEFDLLHLLASQPGEVLSRQLIMVKVWDQDWTKYSRTLDMHVSSLRNKLGDSTWITTIRGVGFRFTHDNHASDNHAS